MQSGYARDNGMRLKVCGLGLTLILPSVCLWGQTPPTGRLRELAFEKRPVTAKDLFESQWAQQKSLTPEWLAAMSWVGRAGAIGGNWEIAETYANATIEGCEDLLRSRALDADGEAPLPIALGAAIETLGKFYDAAVNRGIAIGYLRKQSRKYAGTSIESRINKNLNLLDLPGKPMPELDAAQYLISKPPHPEQLRGSVNLFFFWAHWCSDCKMQKPILERFHERYAVRGLRIVGPTRLYGYDGNGDAATPAEELAYIKGPFNRRYPLPAWMPVPIGEENFVRFGITSTPTLVLVDRSGIVRLYHPGRMGEAELARKIEALL